MRKDKAQTRRMEEPACLVEPNWGLRWNLQKHSTGAGLSGGLNGGGGGGGGGLLWVSALDGGRQGPQLGRVPLESHARMRSPSLAAP